MSYNDMFVQGLEKIASKLHLVSGTATDGYTNYLEDTTKSFEDALFNNKFVRLVVGGIEYIRVVTNTTATRIIFNHLRAAVAASAVVGEASGGQVTITYTTPGTPGNDYSVKFVSGMGTSVPTTAELNGETKLLTVTLGTNELGEVTVTGTEVATVISQLPEFSATMTGAGGVPNPTVADISFTGGDDGISVVAGTKYEVFN